MLENKKILLLVGSPKAKGSTSLSLGSYLTEKLGEKGCTCEKIQIHTGKRDNLQEIIEKVEETEVLIITAPLYVDSIPAPLINVLEQIESSRKNTTHAKQQSLVAILNSGFPEAFQNSTALKIIKNFGDRNNFKWLGGLAMGCGPAISGRPVEQLGGMTSNIVKALDVAADSIASNKAIPQEAEELMSKKLFPIWMYLVLGNRNWKTLAKRFNAEKDLYAKPYGM